MPVAVTAFAPPTLSNLGPGFDVLGCAVEGPGDTVSARRRGEPGVAIQNPGSSELPADPARHTAGIAAREVLRLGGLSDAGVVLAVRKGIPLSSGQGGSAASAVAAAVAVNALFKLNLDWHALLTACLTAEESVSGRHADNLAPALLGGLVLVRRLNPSDVVTLPVPDELRIVIAHPDQRMNTREARAVVPNEFSRETLIFQAAQLGALVAALASDDYDLIARSMHDRVAEPYRAPLLAGFAEVKVAAVRAGALGASISGSGPTSFAFVRGTTRATEVAAAMKHAYGELDIACDVRVSKVCTGARLLTEDEAIGESADE